MDKINKPISFQIVTDRYLIMVITILTGLVFFKLPVLSIPYFWDEAWSYMPAISQMARNGLSLLPDALPPDVYRGHPLLFYFLAGGWMKIAGNSLVSMHSFALLITLITAFSIYYIARILLSPAGGVVAMLLFLIQPLVLGQATFVLPEMLMAFLSLICLFTYCTKRRLWFLFFATCLLYTKETGIVLIFAIGVSHFLWLIMNRYSIFSKKVFFDFLILVIPVVLVLVYFIIQKKIQGWYLFPDHIAMMSHNGNEIWGKLLLCFHLLFTDQRRALVSLISVVLLVLIIIWSILKRKAFIGEVTGNFLWTSFFFICCYLIFCSINFFTNRYLLSMIPLWCILCTAPMVWISEKSKWVLMVFAIGITFVFFLENNGIRSTSKVSAEYNLGFSDAVGVQKDMCDFLQSGDYKDKRIFGTFLYCVYLTNPDAGYLKKGNFFPGIANGAPCSASYLIYSSIEQDPGFESYRQSCNFTLVRRFERGFAWAELYRVN